MSDLRTMSVLTPEQVVERTQSQNVQMAYYNYVRVAASFYDMRLFFGQGNVDPQGNQMFHEQTCVVFSPEFAKILRDNLVQAVEKYESAFGEIKSQPNRNPNPPEALAVTKAKRQASKAVGPNTALYSQPNRKGH